jgi:hypothetical protein
MAGQGEEIMGWKVQSIERASNCRRSLLNCHTRGPLNRQSAEDPPIAVSTIEDYLADLTINCLTCSFIKSAR